MSSDVGDAPRSEATMLAAYLPGDSSVVLREVPVPVPGHGQVLIRMRASGICGSDLRCAYFEHVGRGPEAYQNVVAGHEPAGEVVEVGPGCRELGVGARVATYHISGCGLCEDCRTGYMIGCTSPDRAAYGWQRDGGHATYLLAEERDCIELPDTVSFTTGALAACGLGTVHEGLLRAGLSGNDVTLIVGIGPVGMAAGVTARAFGSRRVIGVDPSPDRLAFAERRGAIDIGVLADDDAGATVRRHTNGRGAEVSIDCSGSAAGRTTAIAGTRRFGRCVLVGEGDRLDVDASAMLIHQQLTVIGSWVTSIGHMQRLVDWLPSWPLDPDVTISHRLALSETSAAYAAAAERDTGKVTIVTE